MLLSESKFLQAEAVQRGLTTGVAKLYLTMVFKLLYLLRGWAD
jgi:hypothetical protein